MSDIHTGDRVVDPMDGAIRTVDYVDGETVYMNDGGAMGVDECESVLLESESAADADYDPPEIPEFLRRGRFSAGNGAAC